MVRAKMRCTQIKSSFYGKPVKEAATIVLQPIYDPVGINKKWCEATPSGQLELTIDNPEAVKQIEGGGLYYVDISPAPENE